jgi:type IV pilus assembly protein PilQ
MRSPPTTYRNVLLAGLIVAVLRCIAFADAPGEITAVGVDAESRTIIISTKGDPGKLNTYIMTGPNRLVMDFSASIAGKVPPRIAGDKAGIKTIRVGNYKSRARVVADFQDAPVPEFTVKREGDKVLVLLGSKADDRKLPSRPRSKEKTEKRSTATTGPQGGVIPPLGESNKPSLQDWLNAGTEPASSDISSDNKGTSDTNHRVDMETANHKNPMNDTSWAEPAEANSRKPDESPNKDEQVLESGQTVAQAGQSSQNVDGYKPPFSKPMRQVEQAGKPDTSRSQPRAAPSSPARQPRSQGVTREIGPPITPPEPDPRLLQQEVTELKFIQVGHNSRLWICAGDHLDYRLTRVSQTKLKLDLINAEIPKVYQKPLRTDLFSTSVEMIIPGSQTIFIQLKEPAPYKVEKKKGVLMVDFSPPRFELPPEMKVSTQAGPAVAAAQATGGRPGNDRGETSAGARNSQGQEDTEDCESSVECLRKRVDERAAERSKKKKYGEPPSSEILNKTVTMDFQDIRLKNAFRLLSEQAAVNITLDPDVDGKTTLRLQNVPLKDVIDTILVTNDLASVMVGDVMRIGKTKKIGEFRDENRAQIETLDQRIMADKNKVKMLEDRKRKAENPAPIEGSIRSEEIGEAGCIKVKEEEICFYYATVRLTYATPSQIVKTLDCMFNSNCPGTGQGAQTSNQAAGSVAEQTALRNKRIEDEKEKLQYEGFTPGSLGGRSRLGSFEELDLSRQRADADTARTEAVRSRTGLPVSSSQSRDPRSQEIMANSTLWPDDLNRMIFIKDTSDRITQMKKVLRTLDVPSPQVIIESRIVRATRDWVRGVGIIWGGRNNQNGQIDNTKKAFWGITGNQLGPQANTATGQLTAGNDIPSRFAVNLPIPLTTSVLANNILGLGMQFGLLGTQYITELDFRLQLGEATGQTKIIARPKVQVLDGKQALIKDGEDIAFATSSPLQGTQTQLVPAYLELKVTPTIFSDGRISMDVMVKDDNVSLIPVPGSNQPGVTRREAKTNMVVRDGETAVIGGIIKERSHDRREGWPGLMNVPLIGYLFSNRGREKDISELLVFITPSILKRPPPAS